MLKKFFACLAIALIVNIASSPANASPTSTKAATLIKDTIKSGGSQAEVLVGGERIRITGMLMRFYRNRGYMPAWSGDGMQFANVDSLVAAVESAYEEGLRPEDYPIEQVESLADILRKNLETGGPPDSSVVADLDLMATATYLSYGYHLLAGRIYTEIMDGEWSDYIWEADLDVLLEEALESGDIGETLKGLVPPHREYEEMREALAEYREIASNGGWPEVPAGANLKLNYRSWRVAFLRERLKVSGDLYEEQTDDEYFFDDAVDDAVLRFQWRHGLWPDGIVGPITLAALNVPVESRINQIELNMERWRWLPSVLGDRYIFVNTAAFELSVIEYGRPVMKMRIVVGKPYWHTPSFSARMTYLVMNPSWNVPRSIAVEEIIPKLHTDPEYLEGQVFKIIRGWGEETKVINPDTVDWPSISEENLNFRFLQPPGPHNPLGRIKFIFPNRFSVYLHDTPSKGLFNYTVRTFSHGCIRIEKPLELANYLLPEFSRKDIVSMIEQGDEQKVPLSEPLMVHSLYWTAWVESDGAVNFREDIYGRDEALLELLSEAPMTP
jgi:murein L,D-transpeptidase YcbB/YkuD